MSSTGTQVVKMGGCPGARRAEKKRLKTTAKGMQTRSERGNKSITQLKRTGHLRESMITGIILRTNSGY
jgi:hypothetical protein